MATYFFSNGHAPENVMRDISEQFDLSMDEAQSEPAWWRSRGEWKDEDAAEYVADKRNSSTSAVHAWHNTDATGEELEAELLARHEGRICL